ncbi:MAG TPA: TerC family protein [Sphingomonas sp.]|nr:TerC family protein [Sphingomonas sp.]
MEFLLTAFLGKPLWMWFAFLVVVAALLAFDLGVLHRKKHEIGVSESLKLSAFYITVGLAYGGWVWWALGSGAGLDYLTGFVVEKSLALDNVFVIATIFGYFAVPREYQHRVLFWGILGVIVLRAVMIGVGAALVTRFEWVLYLFAAFLIFTGIRMLVQSSAEYSVGDNRVLAFVRRKLRVTEDFEGGRFLVRRADPQTGRIVLHATPLFLALVLIEFADVIFAVDSVPAIFAITTDPFIVYTSNIFAVLGLRALYFAVAAMIHRFHYLKYALAVLLVFIGSKVFVAGALDIEKVPPLLSLGATFAILGAGIAYSLHRTRSDAKLASS